MFKLQKCGIHLAPKILAYYQREEKSLQMPAMKKKLILAWKNSKNVVCCIEHT